MNKETRKIMGKYFVDSIELEHDTIYLEDYQIILKTDFDKLEKDLIDLLQEDKWISADNPPKKHKDFEDETIMTTIEGFLITDGKKVVITKLVPEFWGTLS